MSAEHDEREALIDAGYEGGVSAAVEALSWLAVARSQYGNSRAIVEALKAGDVKPYFAASEADQRLADEVSTALLLVDILTGENDAKGWLPSWLWDDWEQRKPHAVTPPAGASDEPYKMVITIRMMNGTTRTFLANSHRSVTKLWKALGKLWVL